MGNNIHNYVSFDMVSIEAMTNDFGGGYGSVSANLDTNTIHAEMQFCSYEKGISHFVELFQNDPEKLQELIEADTKKKNEEFDRLAKAVTALTRSEVILKAENRAQELLRYQLPTNETNQWIDETAQHYASIYYRSISNSVFSFFINVKKDTKRMRSIFDKVPTWNVDWRLTVNKSTFPAFMDTGHYIIKSPKVSPSFDTEYDAMVYAVKRMEEIEKKFFSEMNPVIPNEYKEHFCYFGIPLPGYRFEKENT